MTFAGPRNILEDWKCSLLEELRFSFLTTPLSRGFTLVLLLFLSVILTPFILFLSTFPFTVKVLYMTEIPWISYSMKQIEVLIQLFSILIYGAHSNLILHTWWTRGWVHCSCYISLGCYKFNTYRHRCSSREKASFSRGYRNPELGLD